MNQRKQTRAIARASGSVLPCGRRLRLEQLEERCLLALPTNPTAVTLATLNEDVASAINSGRTVASIVTASGSTDADLDTLGIAITAVDNSHGQWQYTTNGGALWQAVSGMSTTSARLLDPSNSVRFVSNPEFNSQVGPSPTFSFKVWDETSGSIGGTGDTTTGTSFSAQGSSTTLPITAVNDSPTFTLSNTAVHQAATANAVLITSFATGIAPGPSAATDEVEQNLTFQVTVTQASAALQFAVAPSINSVTGVLTFRVATGSVGVATVEVKLVDDGSGSLPNINTSPVQTFTIEIKPFAGDYNRDATVDSADYLVWRKALGTSVSNFVGADGNGDGIVNQDDYAVWKANVGNSFYPGMTPEEFSDSETWVSMHFGLQTFEPVAPVEFGSGTSPIAKFNPTDLDWESWFDSVVQLGAKGVMLTTKFHDGFTLWPSAVTDRDIAHSPWYAANGNRDVVAEFVRAARQRGLKVGLYYSVEDLYFRTLNNAGTITDWTVDLLTELLDGSYGNIDLLFLDGWGNSWASFGGLSYTDVDYATVMGAIRNLQPNMLVTVNDHEHSGTDLHGDFNLWERPVDGGTIPAGFDVFPATAMHDPLHKDLPDSAYTGRWFKHADSPIEQPSDARFAIRREFEVHKNHYVWFANYSLGPSGQLVADTQSMLNEIWAKTDTPVITDDFAAAPGTPLQNLPNWQRTFGSNDITVSPSGSAWIDGGTSVYKRTDSNVLDGRVELDFTFETVPAGQFYIFVNTRVDNTSGNEDRLATYRNANGDVACQLATIHGGAFASLDLIERLPTEPLIAGRRYRIAIETKGNELRGELWEEIDGEMKLYGKAFGTSGANNVAGNGGFGMSTSGSPTTGIHMTGFRITAPDATPPTAPTLSIGNGRRPYLQIQKSADTVYTKIYRSDDGGVTYSLAGFTTDTTFTDNEPPLGATVRYKATSLDANWNVSGNSSVLTVSYSPPGSGSSESETLGDPSSSGLAAGNQGLPAAGQNSLVQITPAAAATSVVASEESVESAAGPLSPTSTDTANQVEPASATASSSNYDHQIFVVGLSPGTAWQSNERQEFETSLLPTSLHPSDDALMDWLSQSSLRRNTADSDTATSDADETIDSCDTHLESTDLALAGLDAFGSDNSGV